MHIASITGVLSLPQTDGVLLLELLLLLDEGVSDVLVHSLLQVLIDVGNLLLVDEQSLLKELVLLVSLGLLLQIEVLFLVVLVLYISTLLP
jgi:hypothetical protein